MSGGGALTLTSRVYARAPADEGGIKISKFQNVKLVVAIAAVVTLSKRHICLDHSTSWLAVNGAPYSVASILGCM